MEYNKEIIQYRISRAKETIKEAKTALDNDLLYSASNRIYYAIFYIVSALSVQSSFSTSKHMQLIGWFNKEFIFSGILDKKLAEIYRKAFKNRQESDYDDFVQLDKSSIEQDYRDMLYFVSEIEKFINKQ